MKKNCTLADELAECAGAGLHVPWPKLSPQLNLTWTLNQTWPDELAGCAGGGLRPPHGLN